MYRRVWLGVCGLLVAGGLGLSLVRSPVASALVFCLVTLLGTVVVASWRSMDENRRPASTATLAQTMAGIAVVAVGIGGLLLLDPRIGVGLGVVAALCSPPVVRLLGVGLGRAPAGRRTDATGTLLPERADGAATEVAATVTSLTDLQLCRAWRRSFHFLGAADPRHRLAVVELREAYLDEMWRRHPAELRAWLADGGRAASGPDRYFVKPE